MGERLTKRDIEKIEEGQNTMEHPVFCLLVFRDALSEARSHVSENRAFLF